MIIDTKSKEKINKMLILSIFILIVLSVFSNQLNQVRLVLYAVCILVGIFSPRYTFVIIILTYTNFLSMFNELEFSGGITDLGLIAGVSCFFCETARYLKEKEYFVQKKIIYNGAYISLLLLLLACSIVVANIRFGQPIVRGIYAFRNLGILLYVLPFIRHLKRNKEEKIVIMEYISNLMIFSIIIIILQQLFINKIEFLKLSQVTRLGEPRILLHSVSPLYCLVFAYNLYRMIVYKEVSIRRILILLVIGVAVFIISQTRIFMASILGIAFFEILVFSKIKIINKIILGIIGIFLFGILLTTNLMGNILGDLFKDVIEDKDSYIRNEAIQYYMSLIDEEFFLFGGGITNEKYQQSPIVQGSEEGYFLVDIGIFGVFFEYGILGILVILILTKDIFRQSLKIENALIANLAKIFCIIIIITAYTVSPLSSSMWVLYVMIYAFVKSEKKKQERNIEKYV